MPRDENGLTPKQARFVEEYLVDFDAANAARRAGYAPRYADRQGYQLLEHPRVAAAIGKAQRERAERFRIRQDDVLRGLLNIARLDIRDLYTEQNALVDIQALPEDVARSVVGVKTREEYNPDGELIGYTRDLKLESRQGAWEKIATMLGYTRREPADTAPPVQIVRIVVRGEAETEVEAGQSPIALAPGAEEW